MHARNNKAILRIPSSSTTVVLRLQTNVAADTVLQTSIDYNMSDVLHATLKALIFSYQQTLPEIPNTTPHHDLVLKNMTVNITDKRLDALIKKAKYILYT